MREADQRFNHQHQAYNQSRVVTNAPKNTKPILAIDDLHVYYGASHALQGVSLVLQNGIISVVGRNGMGKTTLCQTLMGMQTAQSGRIRLFGKELLGQTTHAITRLGIGYVPQGRRLWPSLTVDETLKLAVANNRRAKWRMQRGFDDDAADSNWTIDRIYSVFPRLAERRRNGGGQLSGGEQQMLAISRALLSNPRLLVMDEPTEGLAPVIVDHVRDLLIKLAHEENVAILLIEQNIGVATRVSDQVAIMVNGRIHRVMESKILASDRNLQQQLLGVGAGGHDFETSPNDQPSDSEAANAAESMTEHRPRHFKLVRDGEQRGIDTDYGSVNRWGMRFAPSQLARVELAKNGTSPLTQSAATSVDAPAKNAPIHGEKTAYVVGTFDTKGVELFWLRDYLRGIGLKNVRTIDLSTSGAASRADITPMMVASYHPHGAEAVFGKDRGASVASMAESFARFVRQQNDIGGMMAAGGSGGSFLASAGMRELPLGVPKILVSTVASGDVAPYVGASDMMMMYAVADIQGVNRITELVLGNAAQAFFGMMSRGKDQGTAANSVSKSATYKPALGITMFGVTTPAVQQISKSLSSDFDCLVFHATGTGGRSMENLADAGLLVAMIDLTTTEIADKIVGGVFPAHNDRMGAAIRTKIPYIGSVGALDMVNFGPRAT
ncbi:MAG: Tm-1-like ATP-binding domain-containing protein, partial [Alphaproteobacteria bacterium]|nr:Tm-1-like ATP-binding domain-containing protein [Alphaproteobacteria bacterium]